MRTKQISALRPLLWLLFASNAVSYETLKNAFSENFLIGTMWHGHEVNGSKNIFLQKEKEITLREFNEYSFNQRRVNLDLEQPMKW